MIDFNQVDAPVNVTREFILSRVSEEQIFFYYFGRFELGKVYPSKLRRDKNPSTGFYINKTGNIIYNDIATGEKNNCFTFVAKLFQITHRDALNKIAVDFGLVSSKTITPIAQTILDQGIEFDREMKKDTLIQFSPYKHFTSLQTDYWADYGLSIDDLKKERVFPVKQLFLNKKEIRNLDELCFAYVEEEIVKGKVIKTMVKIYCPYSKTMKWLSNIPLTTPFGLNDLKYGTEQVSIAKAKKDMMVLKKLMESVIGSQNESEAAIPDWLVKHLCFNFPRRTIFWDADETGVTNCKKFNSKGFGYFNTPKSLLDRDIKDVSDYVKAFGLKALEQLLKQKGII
jgi:hypothetical protein